MADRDHLTGLLNRSSFDEALARLCAEAVVDCPAVLVMTDIDHFKSINDTHGHPAGDEVLRQVAGTLARVVRGKGTVYRYGGEEFAFLLPNHSAEEGISVAERARSAVEASTPSDLRVTASFGLAVAPSQSKSPTQWLKLADEALYDAKRRGRNVIRLSGEPEPTTEQSHRRQPIRKVPQPGGMSDDDKERLRRAILKYNGAYCPSCKDDIPLSVHDVTSMGESGKSFIVHCPACGFDTNLPGPGR